MVSTDAEGKITFMNAAAEKITGWRKDDAAGRPFGEVVELVDETSRPLASPVERALRDGDVVRTSARIHGPGGGLRALADSTAPMVNEAGQAIGAVMVFRDVTEQHRLVRQLEIADRLRALGTMAAGVAHEISNPLAFILANLGFVEEQLARLRARASLEHAEEEILTETGGALADAIVGAERVRKTVEDLRAFCRTDYETYAPVDVATVVRWALGVTAHETRSRARVTLELAEVPPIEGNAARLGQVVVNLLINAAHAMPPDGSGVHTIHVSLRARDGRHAVLEVRDDGCGMSAEVARRALEPFFTTKRTGEGTGLGLAVSHGIVSSMGGTLEIESTLDQGTLVRVVLPTIRAPREAADLPRAKVLVVDPDRLARSSVRRILSAEHELTCSSDPTQALAMLDAGMRYDALVCDAGPSAFELSSALELRHPDQARRTIWITERTSSRPLGPRQLGKPLDPERLRKVVREMLTDLGRSAEVEPC